MIRYMMHNQFQSNLRVTALTAILLIMGIATARGSAHVRVELASGRSFSAEVASQTDNDRLWLAFRSRSAELLRPISWNSIVSAELDGQRLSVAELRARLVDDMSMQQTPSGFASQTQDESLTAPELLPEPSSPVDRSISEEARDVLFQKRLLPVIPVVSSVKLDAYIANWDADVEADGLIIQAIPTDAFGNAVPTKGNLEVELYAARRIAFQDGPRKRGRRVERIGRWSQQVLPNLCGPNGVWFKLPFQAQHPEFDTDVDYQGLVHVKLVVPGAGVFESSLDGVRIRPYAPLRDNLQQVEGQRFLPTERTGRGKVAE